MSRIGTGTSGTILQGAGAGVSPKYSTATYPSTSGAAGSTLISNGTNWISTFSGTVLFSKTTVTSTEVKALNTTPKECIAAPGSGKQIILLGGYSLLIVGVSDFTSDYIDLVYDGTTGPHICISLCGSSQIGGTTDKGQAPATLFKVDPILSSSVENKGVYLFPQDGTAITGNAENDAVLYIYLYYTILTV